MIHVQEDVCGGQGHMCAPDGAPADFEELLRAFCEESGHDYEDIRPAAREWINDLKDDLPDAW